MRLQPAVLEFPRQKKEKGGNQRKHQETRQKTKKSKEINKNNKKTLEKHLRKPMPSMPNAPLHTMLRPATRLVSSSRETRCSWAPVVEPTCQEGDGRRFRSKNVCVSMALYGLVVVFEVVF